MLQMLLFIGSVTFLIAAANGHAAEETQSVVPEIQQKLVQPAEGTPSPETSDVRERGGLPSLSIPSGGLSPVGPKLKVDAPTPNLSELASAMQTKHKSLTVQVSFPAGLPVDRQIDITVTTSSGYPDSVKSVQLKQMYRYATGNVFVFNDDDRNRHIRPMKIDILLTELRTNEPPVTFSLQRDVVLEPLFRVTFAPLRLNLWKRCETVGLDDITLNWYSPDNKNYAFEPDTRHIEWDVHQFAWRAREVGTKAVIMKPTFAFVEKDRNNDHRVLAPLPTEKIDFVTWPSKTYSQNLKEVTGQSCTMSVRYLVTSELLHFERLY